MTIKLGYTIKPSSELENMVPPEGLEPPTRGLGNLASRHVQARVAGSF